MLNFPPWLEIYYQKLVRFSAVTLNKEGHQKIGTSLRPVTDWMCDSSHIIEKGMKICDACRKQFKVQTVLEEQDCSVPVAPRTNIAGPSQQ
jgi:hypothetical protein